MEVDLPVGRHEIADTLTGEEVNISGTNVRMSLQS